MTGTPTNVRYMRIDNYTVQLSWSASASNTPPVAGYEVFYAVYGSNDTESGGTTNDATTTISVTLPTLDVMYDLFVVAFSNADNALPSAHSNNVTIELSKFDYLYFHTVRQFSLLADCLIKARTIIKCCRGLSKGRDSNKITPVVRIINV